MLKMLVFGGNYICHPKLEVYKYVKYNAIYKQTI